MDTEIRPGNGDQRRAGYDRRRSNVGEEHRAPMQEQRTQAVEEAGGSAVTGIAALGALALGILALVGVLPRVLMPIGIISAGVALAAIGAAVAARFAPMLSRTSDRRFESVVGGGVSTETIGGLAVIALGILSLVGVATVTLAAVAVIVFGGSLVLGSGTTYELAEVAPEDRSRVREASKAASGTQLFVGLGCVALGILALLGVSTGVLIEVALIAFGGATMLASAAVGGRVAAILRH